MTDTRIIHWPEGEPQPGDTHREYGRTWVYIPMPEGSPEPGVWKSIGGSGGGGGGGGGTVWWHEIQNKPDSYPPEAHQHHDYEILVDTNEDGDYSDAPNLHDTLKEFRDKVDAMMDQMIFGGSFVASTGRFLRLSDRAKAVGFADGEIIPATVTDDQDRLFFISTDNGTVHGNDYMDGDWMVAAGNDWIPINYGNIQIVEWDEIANIPDTIVYDDIAYKPDLEGKPLCRYIDQHGNGKWVEGSSGGGDGGMPGYHTHGFDEIFDGDGNDLNDVIADLQGDIAALQGDLIFAGSYSVEQGRMIVASTQGQMNGFTDGAPLPAASAVNKKFYVMCIDEGTFEGTAMSRGDWLISDGITWIPLNYVQNDFDVPVLPGNATGRVLTWDNQGDMWTENTEFTLSDSGSIDMEGGIEAKGNMTMAQDQGIVSGDGSGLYNLPGMDDYEAPVLSVNGKTGDVTLNAGDVGAATANHKHDDLYQPKGTYVTDEKDPTVPAHVKAITTTNINNWNTAFGWGNHASAGYLKSADLSSYATQSWVSSNYQPKGSYLVASDLTPYATTVWVDSAYAPKGHTHDYAASNHTHSNYAASNHTHSGYLTSSDLTGYATTVWVDTAYQPRNTCVPLSGNSNVSGTITATDFIASSDANRKKNVATAPLGMIDQLRGVEFEWKDSGEMSSGVIAQEIQKVMPHLVHENEHGLSVSYMGIIGYLIEEVKDLRRTIEEMK